MLRFIIEPSMFHTGKYDFRALDEENKLFAYDPQNSNIDWQKDITAKNYVKCKIDALIRLREENFKYSTITEKTAYAISACKLSYKSLLRANQDVFKNEATQLLKQLNNIAPAEGSRLSSHFAKVITAIEKTINQYL